VTSVARVFSSSTFYTGSAAAVVFFTFLDCFAKKAFISFFFSLMGIICFLVLIDELALNLDYLLMCFLFSKYK
jgi:hypothetical protein